MTTIDGNGASKVRVSKRAATAAIDPRTSPPTRRRSAVYGITRTRELVGELFEDVHSKRLDSLANAAVGAMHSVRASIHAIGAAYAAVADIQPKHGVKQVDRFLSNRGIDLDAMLPAWIRFVASSRKELLLAMDWTDFDDDDQSTLCAYVVTRHGRATPVAWRTHAKSSLGNGGRTAAEQAFVDRLADAIPPDLNITLLADRGFGDQKLYRTLDVLGWRFVIRFRGAILVEHAGETRPAADWLPASGRATKLADAAVTGDKTHIGAVVVAHDRKMKDAWFLATNIPDAKASEIVALYGRRFTVEETFRDQKDLHFGRGLSASHIRSAARRDRLLLLLAVAQALLTFLGAASERSGLDAYLKVNTSKRRTHSLFRQGTYWYSAIPTMRDEWFERLMTAFAQVLDEHDEFSGLLGAI